MALTSTNQQAGPQTLTTSRGAALYIGAILGPGLLLLPGLAAAEAGPASILAWIALLGLSGLFAAVFSALGRRVPSAGGVMGYVTAGLGPRAGRATGWIFLAGVVGGAPIVCLIGAGYVTELTGGSQLARATVAAALLLTVIGLAAGGLRASATAQLVLVSLLTSVVVVAVAGSATAARAGNWAPFAPHGWLSVGSAAATLMFSFAGWEAVSAAHHALQGPVPPATARRGCRPGGHHRRAVPGPGGGHDQRPWPTGLATDDAPDPGPADPRRQARSASRPPPRRRAHRC